jgi:hypothetical protein
LKMLEIDEQSCKMTNVHFYVRCQNIIIHFAKQYYHGTDPVCELPS